MSHFVGRKVADTRGDKKAVTLHARKKTPSSRLYDPELQPKRQKTKKPMIKRPFKSVPKSCPTTGNCYRASVGVSSSTEGHLRRSQDLRGEDCPEHESKLKAMRLRLKGQLETIRALESQMAESTHALTVKDAQLTEAFKRLVVLEKKERLRQRAAQGEESLLGAGQGRLRTEESKVLQLKVWDGMGWEGLCEHVVCVSDVMIDNVLGLLPGCVLRRRRWWGCRPALVRSRTVDSEQRKGCSS